MWILKQRSRSIPDEVIIQEVSAHCQGLQHVFTDLSQEPTVLWEGQRVGVTTFVGAKRQQNCGREEQNG